MSVCPYCRSVLNNHERMCAVCGMDVSRNVQEMPVNQPPSDVQTYPTVPGLIKSIRKYRICVAILGVVCAGLLISTITLAVKSNNDSILYGNNGVYLPDSMYPGMQGVESGAQQTESSLQSQIVGDWTTDKGMDFKYMHFKSNGHVTFGDFGTNRENTYQISLNKELSFGKNNPFVYSELAKKGDSNDYWFLEDDALYLGREIYYRK